MTGIFRVELLRALDFIGSEHRRESTTRNIPELGISENKVSSELAVNRRESLKGTTPIRLETTT
jgi:hypothetical protein